MPPCGSLYIVVEIVVMQFFLHCSWATTVKGEYTYPAPSNNRIRVAKGRTTLAENPDSLTKMLLVAETSPIRLNQPWRAAKPTHDLWPARPKQVLTLKTMLEDGRAQHIPNDCLQFHVCITYLILIIGQISYLTLSLSFQSCLTHEPLARISKATSVPHNDFNKMIDWLIKMN